MQAWKPPSFDEPLPPLPQALDFADAALSTLAPRTTSALPTEAEVQALRSRAHQEGFVRGLQEGLQEGRLQGEAVGREEGLRAGLEQGRAEGFEEGLAASRNRIAELSAALAASLEALEKLPHSLEPALTDWVYQTAVRLAGQPALAREPFIQAVQEALMRLPHPGETLFLRIAQADLQLWNQLQQQVPASMAVSLLEDPHLAPGHAYLEVAGTRVDVGAAARDALVRSALGLLPVTD